jgi:hypothetical protein
MGAYGYNYYSDTNRARADDLLVRERAAGDLSQSVVALTALHTEFYRVFCPPPTRENPFPPPEASRAAQEILRLRDRINRLGTAIRGMPAPTQDKIWKRFRSEIATLDQLLACDYTLVTQCTAVRERCTQLTPEGWQTARDVRMEIDAALGQIEAVMADRRRVLSVI